MRFVSDKNVHMVGWTVYCNQLVFIRLNNACDVSVQLIFPFRSNKGNPVLNCKYELQIDLRIGIGHVYFVPHGTWKNGWVFSDSINILSLTGHLQEYIMRFLQKYNPMKLLRHFVLRNDNKKRVLSLRSAAPSVFGLLQEALASESLSESGEVRS